MPIKTILFDLDETLYSPDAGIWQAIKLRIEDYMVNRLGIPQNEVDDLRQKYYEAYGTSLRGLEKDYNVLASDYLGYVHNIPIEDFLQPDQRLREILKQIPIRKVIFTNANVPHAERVLNALGIADQFSMIIDIVKSTPSSKPFPEAFIRAMNLIGDPDPSNFLLVDDAEMNVRTAIQLGMHAILVNVHHSKSEEFQRISSIYELTGMLPEIYG